MYGLYELMQWMAETVYTGDHKNEWYYTLVKAEDVYELLDVIGKQLLEIFA